MKKVLVTGATGTIGRQVLSHFPGTAHGITREMTDPVALRAAADGAEAVFLVWPFATADGFAEVLGVLAEQPRRVVYLSSAAARPHELVIEGLLAESGLEWTSLRPHAFAANTSRWAAQIRSGEVRQPYGEAVFAPIHERDVAAVAARVLLDGGYAGQVLTLTGPRALSQREQAGIIGEAAGSPVRWVEEEPGQARARLLAEGWPEAGADSMLRAQAELVAAPGPVTRTVEEVTGVAPAAFEEWARDHAAEFRGAMLAARIHEYGDASVISMDEVPVPAPGPGEVLIKVAATSFNPSEVGLRLGMLHEILGITLPHTLGWDAAGTVVGTGDRVIGLIDAAAAEYAVVPADLLARAPETIPLADSAAIPVAGLTAWQAVFEHARLQPGERVLINGAAGGVGLFAVQLAKHAGATVVATASPRSAEAVKALGADEVVDYTAEALPGGNDVVINLAAIGPDQAAELVPLGRRFVSITVPIEHPAAVHFVTRNDAAQLAELVALIDKGVVEVSPARSRPLTDLPDIHREAENGLIRGKIIVRTEK